MPKIKTHKGTAKRVRLTVTGKLVRSHVNHGRHAHFLQKKSASRKRSLVVNATVTGSSARNIKRALGALK